MLTLADWSTTVAMSLRQLTLVRRKRCLIKPKHQSGENFVCPTIKNESVICVQANNCAPQQILEHSVIFCPMQLSACRWTSLSQDCAIEKRWCSNLTIVFAPFLVSFVSSIRYVTWRGIASQHTPNRAHFRGVNKYIGPGCRG